MDQNNFVVRLHWFVISRPQRSASAATAVHPRQGIATMASEPACMRTVVDLMPTVRQCVVGVALLIAAIGDSSGQTRSFRSVPASPPPVSQPTISDQRGTDQSPLTVKVLPSPVSKEDAERDDRA